MSVYSGTQRVQDILDKQISVSIMRRDDAWEGGALIVRRNSDDETTTVYFNQSVGFVDNDSLCDGSASSPGSQSIATWKDAAGASDLFVTSWLDMSRLANDISQVTTSKQPKLNLNGSGVMVTMYFDGSDDTLDKTVAYPGSTKATFFVVYKRDGSQATYASIFATAHQNASNTLQLDYLAQNTNLVVEDSLGVVSRYNVDTTPDNDMHLVSVVADGINVCNAYLDGSGTPAGGTIADGFLNRITRFRIARNRNGASYFKGEIAEFIMVDREMTSSERIAIEQELINDYGIS